MKDSLPSINSIPANSLQDRHTLINIRILSHPTESEGGMGFAVCLFTWLDAKGQIAYPQFGTYVYPILSWKDVGWGALSSLSTGTTVPCQSKCPTSLLSLPMAYVRVQGTIHNWANVHPASQYPPSQVSTHLLSRGTPPYIAVLDCSLQELVHTLLHHVYIFYTHNTVYHSFHSLITQCKKNHFPLGWVVVFLTCLLDSLTWWVSNLASADTVNNTIKLFHTFKYSHILIFKCSTYSHIQMSKAFWNFTRSQFICFVLFPGL